MPLLETGKTRSQRIQLDYYRQRGGLYYFKWILVGIALTLATLYTAYVIASGGGKHLSTGPMSVAHASFENDCSACHKDFLPIGSDALKLDPTASLNHLESACQSCHTAGDHYRSVMSDTGKQLDQNCSRCHAEHLGRDNNLLAVNDSLCVECHQNLSSVCAASHSPRVKPDVVQFTRQGHGDFRSITQGDSGRIKFDHAQHMLPGQVDAGDRGGITLEMLEPNQREAYRREGQSDDAMVSLDCASCHEFDGNPMGHSIVAADEELGRYMAPIDFDKHCSACHSMNPEGRRDDTLALPHAAPWAETEMLLESKLNASLIRQSQQTPDAKPPRVQRPGLSMAGAVASEPANSPSSVPGDVSFASAETIADAVNLVREQCKKCHDDASLSDEAIRANRDATAPSLIPARWFQFGLYDHAAHREISCRYCHSAAYPNDTPGKAEPLDQTRVMIDGIDSCTGCHRAVGTPTPESITGLSADVLGGQTTWASDQCMLCHRYHTLSQTPIVASEAP